MTLAKYRNSELFYNFLPAGLYGITDIKDYVKFH